jgi:hypothetical protein
VAWASWSNDMWLWNCEADREPNLSLAENRTCPVGIQKSRSSSPLTALVVAGTTGKLDQAVPGRSRDRLVRNR